MSTPHKHAALIKAWADGAKIECRAPEEGANWRSVRQPLWEEGFEYRIKPNVEQRRCRVALFETVRVQWTETADDQDEATYIEEERRDFHSWLTDWIEYEVEVQP